jgi:hypothetical protein
MTFNSRVVITKDKLETWLSTATRQRHLSEDPVSRLLRASREPPLIFRTTRHRFQKDWYNTPYSCHICGRYHDRPATREEHYRSARKRLCAGSPEFFG